MPFIKNIYDSNFLEYASYVIKDRAIPHIDDGLKPVQRRILHTLWEIDDGKFHKAANVVGQCMKYHPHGDASIGDALVSLANKVTSNTTKAKAMLSVSSMSSIQVVTGMMMITTMPIKATAAIISVFARNSLPSVFNEN